MGPLHEQTLASLNQLGLVHKNNGEPEKAVELMEEVLAARKKNHPKNHFYILHAQANLAVLHRESGDIEKAIPLLEDSNANGKNDPRLRFVAAQLAKTYLKADMPEKALAQARGNVESAKRELPADSLAFAGELATAGDVLLQLEQWDEAEPLLHEALTIRDQRIPNDWIKFNSSNLLGAALFGQGKLDAAEPMLLDAYQGFELHEGTIPPNAKYRVTEALERLVRLYEAIENTEKADHWRKKLQTKSHSNEKQTTNQ